MIDEQWLARQIADHGRPGDPDAVPRLRALLTGSALGFAESRPDVASPEIAWPQRGIHPDEAASFLRTVDLGHASVSATGHVSLHRVRPKTPIGRYALLSKSGAGVSVNLEYLIQIAAVAEVVEDLGWPPEALDFERGEFDALGTAPDGRVTLAVEAKARVTGSDSLEKLVRRWLALTPSPELDLTDNAGRKYRELRQLCEAGPVTVWLVAAGARWALRASLAEGVMELEPAPQPAYTSVNGMEDGSGRQVLWVRPFDARLHQRGTLANKGQCSWFCRERAVHSVHVREAGGGQSTFGLCETHKERVEAVYGPAFSSGRQYTEGERAEFLARHDQYEL